MSPIVLKRERSTDQLISATQAHTRTPSLSLFPPRCPKRDQLICAYLSVFRSVECGSLPQISAEGVAVPETENSLALTVISHPTDPPTSAKVIALPLPDTVILARKASRGMPPWSGGGGGGKNEAMGGGGGEGEGGGGGSLPVAVSGCADGRETSTDVNPALSLENTSGDTGVPPPHPVLGNSAGGGGACVGGDGGISGGFSLSSLNSLGGGGASVKGEAFSSFLDRGAGILSQIKEQATERLKEQGVERCVCVCVCVCA